MVFSKREANSLATAGSNRPSGPLALLGAFNPSRIVGGIQPQTSQTVGFGDSKASTSRLRGSLPPRRGSGVVSRSVTARRAKLLASLIPGVAVLLYAK